MKFAVRYKGYSHSSGLGIIRTLFYSNIPAGVVSDKWRMIAVSMRPCLIMLSIIVTWHLITGKRGEVNQSSLSQLFHQDPKPQVHDKCLKSSAIPAQPVGLESENNV